MKKPIQILLIFLVLVLIVAAGFLVVPRLLYKIPLFQSWVTAEIDSQSGGVFEFDSIEGDAKEARLYGPWLDLKEGQSNVLQARFDELVATFELLPVAMLNLDLKEVTAVGGEVVVDLRGGEWEQIRLPVNAENFSMTEGRLQVQNVQGYHLVLENTHLDVEATETGITGAFRSPGGTIGSIELEGVVASFVLDAEGLRVSSFQALMAGESSLEVQGALDLNAEGMPMDDVSLAVSTDQVKVLLDALGYSQSFDGNAEVKASLSGQFRPEIKAVQGGGTAELKQIQAQVDLPKYPGFDGSGILQDLQTITGLEGNGEFTLKGDRIVIDPLKLNNDQLRVDGTADVGFNRQLSGDLTLLASEKLAAGIPDVAKGVFKIDESNRTIIPFKFVGTTNQPAAKTDSVISKALMNPVNAVKGAGGFLGGLFGGGKEKEEKPEKNEEDSE